MSVKVMAHVFDINDKRLSPQDRLILLAYVDHADEGGKNIYPAVATVAAKTGYSPRTVQRRTRNLEEAGLLIPDGSVYLDGTRGTGLNKWRYNWDWAQPTEKVSDCRPKEKRVTTVTKRVTTVAEKGDIAVSPDPSLTIHNHPSGNGNATRSAGGETKRTTHDDVRAEIEHYFTEKTGLCVPANKKEAGKLWWTPLRKICAATDWDVGRAKAVIDWTIGHMDKNRLTMTAPNSIEKIAIAEIARRGRAGQGWNGKDQVLKVSVT